MGRQNRLLAWCWQAHLPETGLPYAVLEAGFYTGIFLLVGLCAVTNW